eukprot:6193646-Pleurochrysis_carterae.AAC.1
MNCVSHLWPRLAQLGCCGGLAGCLFPCSAPPLTPFRSLHAGAAPRCVRGHRHRRTPGFWRLPLGARRLQGGVGEGQGYCLRVRESPFLRGSVGAHRRATCVFACAKAGVRVPSRGCACAKLTWSALARTRTRCACAHRVRVYTLCA